MDNLSVYSASAGSGKTFTIAYEYISMMLKAENYAAFRNILAVTFTNKACDEMKSRIVLNLFQISNVDKAPDDLKKKTKGIIDKIKERTGLDESTIIRRSRNFFTQIIHDYSFFSVHTIDSFFQKIVRNLTYELDMQQNYELELNTSLVISQLVDDIMLRAESDAELNKYISSMIEDNIEAEKKWIPKEAIKSFILQAVAADYKFSDFDIDTYEAKIDGIIKDFCDEFKKNIDGITAKIKSNGLNDDDFSHISGGIYNTYKNFSNFDSGKSLCLDMLLDKFSADKFLQDNWFKKDSKNTGLVSVFKPFTDEISKLDSVYDSKYKKFCTAYMVKKNLNLVRLYAKASEILHENLGRDSVFLLSDVPSLLSKIIRSNDDGSGDVSVMPFVFESIGTKYDNFMIDEFQDTGIKQWDIFQTMLHDALSQGHDSIVVGDIKQSIYSWRGGDWRILSRLANRDREELLADYCGLKSLTDNHRTARNIVEFNNDFFYQEYTKNESLFGDEKIDPQFKSLYDDVWQGVTEDKDSEINVRLYGSDGDSSDETLSDRIFKDMVSEIENLQLNHNVPPSKIMILVRKKSEASFVANSFLAIAESDRKPGVRYDVVSDEALYISTNRAVKIILAYMRYILSNKAGKNDDDKSANYDISLVESAYLYYLEKNNLEVCSCFNKEEMVQAFLEDLNPDGDPLEKQDLGKVKFLSEKQSFEIVDIMIGRLKLNENGRNVPFLIAFRNVVHNFSEKSTDLQSFIDYWDERGSEETLKIPESQNAMKIITIHKSKGLEADYIFIPFCNWEFVGSGGVGVEYMFVDEPIEGKLSGDGKVIKIPVAGKKALEKTSMAAEYNANLYRKAIESYNLLYVAFTRAKYGLYVSAIEKTESNKDEKKAAKPSKLTYVSQLLSDYFSDESLDGDIVVPTKGETLRKRSDGWTMSKDSTANVRIFTKGGLSAKDEKKTPSNGDFITDYPVCKKPQISIVHHLRDDVEGEWSARIKGTKYHAIFEQIITAEDVEPAVAVMFNNGEIDRDTYENLVREFSSALSCEPLRKWFDGSCKVYNEFNIIYPMDENDDDKLKRPDRVMVFSDEVVILDYKFGTEKHDMKYAKQVARYKELISQMKQFSGKNVSAYIWYYFKNELVKVDSPEAITTINLS